MIAARTWSLFVMKGWLLCTTVSLAQSATYMRHFTKEEGLPGNTVYDLLEDDQGYLWIATDEGVARFDGHRFVKYSIDDGLCDNEVLGLCKDLEGRIWFLTLKGCLCCYDHGVIRNKLNMPQWRIYDEYAGINSRLVDSKKNIWFTVYNYGLLRIDSTLKLSVIPKPIGAYGNIALYESAGQLHWSVNGNVYTVDEQNTVRFLRNEAKLYKGDGSVIDSSNFLMGEGGLYLIKQGELKLAVPADSLPGFHSNAGVVGGQNNVFYYFLNNISNVFFSFSFHQDEFKWETIPWEIPRFARSYLDSEGNQWLASLSHGVYMIPAGPAQGIAHIRYANDAGVACLEVDNYGLVWAGTTDGKLKCYDGHELKSTVELNTSKGDPSLRCIRFDSENNLWAIFRSKVTRAIRIGQYDVGKAQTIVDHLGNVKSLTTFRDGIAFSAGSAHLFRISESSPMEPRSLAPHFENRSYAPYHAKNGNLWFETGNRLYHQYADTLVNYPQLDSLFWPKIADINETDGGLLLVATMGNGVYLLKNLTPVFQLSTANGLRTNECKRLLRQGDSYYLCTTNGMVTFKVEDEKMVVTDLLDADDGLPETSFTDVEVRNNLIYLATESGMFIYDQHTLHTVAPAPHFHLLSFQADAAEIDFSSEVVLAPGNNNIAIEYTAIAFNQPSRVVYQYMINESGEWKETSEQRLQFPDLPAGAYHIQLRAKKFNSAWSDPKSVRFEILAPVYLRWWFIATVAGLFALTLVLTARFFAKRKLELALAHAQREQAVLAERNRISTDMHDDLGAELTHMVVLSKMLRNAGGSSNQSGLLQRIEQTGDEVIQKMNEVIWSLRHDNDTLEQLVNYMERYANDLLENLNIGGNVVIPKSGLDHAISAEWRRNIFLVFKEALHNARKYSNATRIDVAVAMENNRFQLLVHDNGTGFDTGTKATGNGLRNMRARAEALGGTLQITSETNRGTRVMMDIPLNQTTLSHTKA